MMTDHIYDHIYTNYFDYDDLADSI